MTTTTKLLRDFTTTDGIPISARWIVANSAAKTALSLSSADIAGFCYQVDNTELSYLASISPAVWKTAGPGAAGATGATGSQGATGATGATGAAGSTGATGATGSTPPLGSATPQPVASAGSVGTSTNAPHEDHAHAHGTQTDGTMHAVAVANAAAGFLSGADKAKLDGLVLSSTTPTVGGAAAAIGTGTTMARADHAHGPDAQTSTNTSAIAGKAASTVSLGAGAGMTGGGDLSANRTFNVIANADGSMTVNADDIQVGVLATDAQHGARGGGAQHSNVVAAGAAGFISGADKTKLDGITAGANIASVFGRTIQAIVAVAGDYLASQVGNDSGVASGAGTVKTALDALATLITNLGAVATQSVAGLMSAADKLKSDRLTTIKLASDQTSTAISFSDCIGLSFPVTSGVTYRFKFVVVLQNNSTTAATKISVNGPTFSMLAAFATIVAASLTTSSFRAIQAYDQAPSGTATTTANTDQLGIIEGIITPSASGTLALRFATTTVTTTTATVRANSYGEISIVS